MDSIVSGPSGTGSAPCPGRSNTSASGIASSCALQIVVVVPSPPRSASVLTSGTGRARGRRRPPRRRGSRRRGRDARCSAYRSSLMFARIRSVSTSSRSRHSRTAATAPPAYASVEVSAGHSACQAPAARSSSCSPPVRTPADACARRAHAAPRRRAPGSACAASSTTRRRRRLGDLSDVGLREQHDVERDLVRGARRRVQRGCERGDGRTVGVPGHELVVELELRGEAGADVETAVAEGRERAGRATELCRVAQCAQPRVRTEQAGEPAGGRVSERRRHRLLQQRPCRHRRRAVRLGEPRARRLVRRGRRRSPADRIAATSIAAVSSTSWLVAPRCTPSPARARTDPDERLDRVAGSAALRRAPRCRRNASNAPPSTSAPAARASASPPEHRPQPRRVGHGLPSAAGTKSAANVVNARRRGWRSRLHADIEPRSATSCSARAPSCPAGSLPGDTRA